MGDGGQRAAHHERLATGNLDEVIDAPLIQRLLAGGLHRGEGRVTRLVDLVGHGDDGGQRGAHGLGVAVDGAFDGDGTVLDAQGAGQAQERHVGLGCQCGGQHGGHRVQRGHAGEHQVDGAALLRDLCDRDGQNGGGRDDVGALEELVRHNVRTVGAHLQGAHEGVLGVLGAHRQRDDLGLAPRILFGFLELDGSLDGVLIQFVEHIVLTAHQAAALKTAFGLHVGDMLHTHDNSHDF